MGLRERREAATQPSGSDASPTERPMPHVRLADCSLSYAERGAGPPLLLLMGLGGSHRSWGEPFLRALERQFRLIALDHRGTGGSTRGNGVYSIARLADDAAEAL